MTETADNTTVIKAVTIYAGSGDLVADIYKEHAFELGKLIAEEGWVQVNGGGSTGLMGAATHGGKSVGGIVDSVILRQFLGQNEHSLFRDQYVLDTMQERKKGLFDHCDAIVALPGGLGTLDELAEVACSRQLCFHQKPIVVVNTKGYFDGIKIFIENGIKEKFITSAMTKGGLFFVDDPKEAINYLKNFRPVVIDKASVHSGEMKSDKVTP